MAVRCRSSQSLIRRFDLHKTAQREAVKMDRSKGSKRSSGAEDDDEDSDSDNDDMRNDDTNIASGCGNGNYRKYH